VTGLPQPVCERRTGDSSARDENLDLMTSC
jgi:hypothetical protein